jgi:hypothetical protein
MGRIARPSRDQDLHNLEAKTEPIDGSLLGDHTIPRLDEDVCARGQVDHIHRSVQSLQPCKTIATHPIESSNRVPESAAAAALFQQEPRGAPQPFRSSSDRESEEGT